MPLWHAPLGCKPKITNIDRDQQQVTNRFQIWPKQVGTALISRKAEPIHLHNVVDILCRRKSACDINVVVVPAQKEIVAEVEILFFAMASDLVWKTRAQPAPKLIMYYIGWLGGIFSV